MSAERKAVRNLYYDHFAEKYQFHYGLPYAGTQADFVQLNTLTQKSGKLSERLTLEVWERGVKNYFASDLGAHTLKHLCSMFVPFWRQPLDRFGKPREVASKVGASEPVKFASWHPKFLAASWKLAQRNKTSLDAIDVLFDEVVDMDEVSAFKRLKAIEVNHA